MFFLPIQQFLAFATGKPLAKHLFLLISLAFGLVCHAEQPQSQINPAPKIAIIIDDLGYDLRNGTRSLQLPGLINVAILPHTPNAVILANLAANKGREILVHAPMSNLHAKPLGKGGLTTEMNKLEFVNALDAAIDSVPHASGLSNHMGSELTQQSLPMGWLMEELTKRSLFFVDSRTTARTLASQVAADFEIPHIERNVFLDHSRSPEHIAQQFNRLLKLAQKQGLAVAIGHPYPETLQLLEEKLPELKAQGFQLVSISQAISHKAALAGKTQPESLAKLETKLSPETHQNTAH